MVDDGCAVQGFFQRAISTDLSQHLELDHLQNHVLFSTLKETGVALPGTPLPGNTPPDGADCCHHKAPYSQTKITVLLWVSCGYLTYVTRRHGVCSCERMRLLRYILFFRGRNQAESVQGKHTFCLPFSDLLLEEALSMVMYDNNSLRLASVGNDFVKQPSI